MMRSFFFWRDIFVVLRIVCGSRAPHAELEYRTYYFALSDAGASRRKQGQTGRQMESSSIRDLMHHS